MELMRKKIEELLEQESLINEYGVRLHFIGDMKLLTDPVRAGVEKATRVTAHNNQRVLLICVAYTSCHEIMHAVQECCKEKLNEVQALKEEKVTNGAFSKIDEGLKGYDFDLLSQDSCKEYRIAIKACSTEVESAARNDGLFENNIENHIGNDTEAETTLYNGLVELTEERKDIQDEFPFIKLADTEKNMYMAVAPDPDILIRSSGEARLSTFLLWQTTTCPLYAPTTLWPEIDLRHFIWAVLNFHRHYFYLEKEKKQF
ncbi:hypothetical protein VIGAN_01315100 [Vigna angularis var. angularis]|uniref:Alkyl transferase n=1 Tax=Vigna angularis var. angularis TaxID=157739 RepID=A0A0S3R3Y8_PHAAN|nr:hypothetical protein VIGAN_01315100 [Vigna angularis var. angularis]